MLGASRGIPGQLVADPFLRMARGRNALNERNTSLGRVTHGDGWGAVVAEDGVSRRVRGAGPCWDDPAYEQVRSAQVKLLHARLASRGTIGVSNSHPFSAVIRGGTWYFCHNGTLRDEPEDGTTATDSERFFRRLTVRLEREDPVEAFATAAGDLSGVTALNALLLGPGGLWAFCVWTDPRFEAYYTLAWAETPCGVLVASEPLQDVASRWTAMENGSALWASARSADVRLSRLRLPGEFTPAAA